MFCWRNIHFSTKLSAKSCSFTCLEHIHIANSNGINSSVDIISGYVYMCIYTCTYKDTYIHTQHARNCFFIPCLLSSREELENADALQRQMKEIRAREEEVGGVQRGCCRGNAHVCMIHICAYNTVV